MFRSVKHWVWLLLLWFVLAGQAWAMPCDVDNDGDIDLNDLTLIQKSILARAAVSGADDPRDPDQNGLINSIDGRLCALRCTRAKCSTINQMPFANAGPDQTVRVGDLVGLSGAASSDPDGDSLTYTWTFNNRPLDSLASLIDGLTVAPRFTADKPGQYLIQLIVSDGKLDSVPDTVIVSTENSRPIANAGPDQSVRVGTLVMLNGGRSTDVDGDPLTYTWQLASVPPGSGATLGNPDTVNPTLLIDQPGSYLIALTVSDGKVPGLPDSVTVTTENSPPVANPGANQSIPLGATITLDGSHSSDVDGNPLTFRWSLLARPPGSAAVLSNPNTVTPSFNADAPGTYVAQLIVNDGSVDSAPASVTLTTANAPPIANAGPDQSVPLGSSATLDGSASRDPEGAALTYSWSLTGRPAGSAASLSDGNTVNPSFTLDRPGNYIAQLIVGDGQLSSAPDTVTLSTTNSRPVADAGAAQTVTAGTPVQLDGSASRDADSDPITFTWSLTSLPPGSKAAITPADGVSPSFVPDLAGTYIAQLIVSDGQLSSLPATVVITVSAANRKPVAVAEAVPTQTTVGSPVVLKGSASSDPDGDSLTWAWSIALRPGGSNASIVSPTAAETSFVPDVPGDYSIQLVVRDGKADSVPALVVVEALAANRPPVITSTAVTSATANVPYSYDVEATDPDTGDILTFSLTTAPAGMTISSTTGLILWTPTAGQVGNHQVVVRVTDTAGHPVEQAYMISVSQPVAQMPVPNVVGLQRSVATVQINAASLTLGNLIFNHSGAAEGQVLGQNPLAGALVAVGTPVSLTISLGPDHGLPPSPDVVAPKLDRTVATTIAKSTEFLYAGSNPVQTGVAPGTIAARRAAVIRGRVLDRDNNPLPGVVVTVQGHQEFGQTISRADGQYDLAVNGGGALALNYKKANYLPGQRQVNTPWQDYVIAPDVALVPLDARVTTVTLAGATTVQVARGSVVSDRDGTRQATLLIPPGTQAEIYLPDGTRQPIGTLNLRATEYTVGAGGPKAMPAELPPTSGYTYAVDLSADEASVKVAGKDVLFSQPVPFYVENFLGFPVGIQVPVGYYDREKSAWIPADDGRVIKILSMVGGRAELDTDGDGGADSGAALGVTDAERERLATLYSPGQTLWRVPLAHLSTYDCNYGIGPPDGATDPEQASPQSAGDSVDDSCEAGGSVIECENQTLRESVPVAGTPFALHYATDRVVGRTAARSLSINLSGASVPPVLKRIELSVEVAGRVFRSSHPAAADQGTTFTWDGVNAFGQPVQGGQPARVRIGYVYDGYYLRAGSSRRSFGLASGARVAPLIPARQESILWQEHQLKIGPWDSRAPGIGGWSLSPHHAYDPVGKMLYLGDGARRTGSASAYAIINTVAGTGVNALGGDGGPATASPLSGPHGLAVGPDGSLYIGESGRVRRVSPNGIITTIAGTGTGGFGGDGGPAIAATLSMAFDLAVGPDGSIYMADTYNHRIRRISPDGMMSTVAGNGQDGGSGDGGPATSAALSQPVSVAVAPDGTLYIAEWTGGRVRKVSPDGVITTLVGGGAISKVYGVDVGPDGSVYIADLVGARVRRVAPDGVITTVAGTDGLPGYGGDGGAATAALLSGPHSVAVAPNGDLYIADLYNNRIRRVSTAGVISTVAGRGALAYSGDGGPATAAGLNAAVVKVGRDGSLYIADHNNHRVRRVAVPIPGFSADSLAISSDDGAELYEFDPYGRHLSTRHTLTGAVRYQFSYDSAGHLTGITDGAGNTTTIERDGAGSPTAIIAPFGQRTTLAVDSDGYLASVTNPAGETHGLRYGTGGLLTEFENPRRYVSTMTYDGDGLLVKDADAAGGSQTLTRLAIGAGGPISSGRSVTRTTALGRSTTYGIEQFTTGNRRRPIAFADGTNGVTAIGTDGSYQTTHADGTATNLLQGPDPRFSMQSPVAKTLTVTTPGGLSTALATERTAQLADDNNPLSLTKLTDKVTVNGRITTRVYDAATRTRTTTTAAGRTSTVTLDALGRPVHEQSAGLLATSYSYDTHGRLATITQGSGAEARTVTFSYNAAAQLASMTDPLARVARFAYDPAGRVTRQTFPDGREVLFGYDAIGNLTSLKPPGRPPHAFVHTPVNLQAEYVPPAVGGASGKTEYTYNADRQLEQMIRPDGQTMVPSYDAAGRLASVTLPDGPLTYSYDPTTGKRTAVTNPGGGTLGFSYDGSLLTGSAWTGPVAGQVGFAYDNDRRVKSVSVNGANAVAYSYDADSLLARAGNLTLTRSAQNGLLTGSTLGRIRDTWAYNGFGEPSSYTVTDNGAPLHAVTFSRDKLGRITAKNETTGGVITSWAYDYDLAGRLKEVKRNGAVIATYGYDANGNRTHLNGALVARYDDQDRMLEYAGAIYEYSANGELKKKTEGGNATEYVYDVLGNLRQVTFSTGGSIEYVIDGRSRRIGKKVNGTLVQSFLYQDQLKPVAELDGAGNVVSRFVYATRVNVPDYMVKGGATYRIVTDHLGSPRMVIDTVTGAVAQRMDYDAWGNVETDTNPGFQPFGFAGGAHDSHTNFVRFGIRDYDAAAGRWTTRDPAGFTAGETSLYAYTGNQPVDTLDPVGARGVVSTAVEQYDTWATNLAERGGGGRLVLAFLVSSIGSVIEATEKLSGIVSALETWTDPCKDLSTKLTDSSTDLLKWSLGKWLRDPVKYYVNRQNQQLLNGMQARTRNLLAYDDWQQVVGWVDIMDIAELGWTAGEVTGEAVPP